MLKSEIVGHLRRLGIWSAAQGVHRRVGPAVCAAVHLPVLLLGDRVFSANLVMKHRYDRELVWVRPQEIETYVDVAGWRRRATLRDVSKRRRWYLLGDGLKSTTRHVSRNFHGRFIGPGDWDLVAEPFDKLPVIEELFIEGRPPRETETYRRYSRNIREGKFGWTKGMRTIEDLDRHFEELRAIYDDMRVNGYRLQRSLEEEGSDEVRVCVDRTGSLGLYGGGSHRVSMAKAIGLEAIPVLVKRVHPAWVTECMERFATRRPQEAVAQGLVSLAPDARTPRR